MFPIDFFWRAAARYPERIAVHLPGAELTYAQLAGRVQSVAAAFTTLDAEPQSRVAIGAANSVEHLVALLATLAAGKVSAGRWWSVTSTSMPAARAAATPSNPDTPLSTVTISAGLRSRASATSPGVRP